MLFVYILLRISVHQYHHTTVYMFYIITQPLWFYVNKCACSNALCSMLFSFIASDRQIEMKSSIKLTSLSTCIVVF